MAHVWQRLFLKRYYYSGFTMIRSKVIAFSLVELLIVIIIVLLITGALFSYYSFSLKRAQSEKLRNDLLDRAYRLSNYLSWELRETGLGIGSIVKCRSSTGSLMMDGVTYNYSLIPGYNATGNDKIIIIKGIKPYPYLYLTTQGNIGDTDLSINRRVEDYEIDPTNPYKKFVVFENHHTIYEINQVSGNQIQLFSGLSAPVPVGTYIYLIRRYEFYLSSGKIYQDDGIITSVLDDAVDGLKFQYILKDGTVNNNPSDISAIRAIRVFVLLRSMRENPNYINSSIYVLGSKNYGPYNDHFYRYLLDITVEVKNYGL